MSTDKLYCKYCLKECHNLNSLRQHEIRCKMNPERKAFDQLKEYSGSRFKGQTKETNSSIAKQAAKLKDMYASGELIPAAKGKPGTFRGKHHTEDTKQRIGKGVSKSRLEGYANGSIEPAKGVGRGKYSYLIYNDKTYMLRSTYEFIFALYLAHIEKVDFDMETVRVSALRDNKYGKTFISDFNVDNVIIEVKGIPSRKDVYIKESFEAAGYEFVELFHESIMKLKQILINNNIPIENLLTKVIDGHNLKQYFTYTIE